MSDKATPETDAFLHSGRAHYMSGEFGRKLERERDEAREQVRTLRHWLECIHTDTEGFADGAPDSSAHDKMCLHISAIAKAALDGEKGVLP